MDKERKRGKGLSWNPKPSRDSVPIEKDESVGVGVFHGITRERERERNVRGKGQQAQIHLSHLV